jgi:hypothetical protein
MNKYAYTPKPVAYLYLEDLVTDQDLIGPPGIPGWPGDWHGEFQPAALGILAVSHRQDGSYYVLSGQGRVERLRLMGYDEPVRCQLFTELTPAREEELRRGFQDRIPLSLEDEWRITKFIHGEGGDDD